MDKTHEEELRELFEKSTTQITPELDEKGLRAMSFAQFKIVAELLMNRGFIHGRDTYGQSGH